MISYMIPLYIKFGMEKSRIVSVSGMAAIFLILYLGIKISKERNGSIMKIISRAEKLSDGIVILLIFAVSVILICISVVCAMKAMKKREF